MAAVPAHHRHKVAHSGQKPFKSRHASKNALRDRFKGKIEKPVRRTPHRNGMSKQDRRNQAKQKRLQNHQEHVKANSVFAGRDGAPRIVAVVPLCHDVSARDAVRSLNASVDVEQPVPEEGWVNAEVNRFKQKVQFVVGIRDLMATLDACRVADMVLFVLSAHEDVDELGELMLRAIESQGISNFFAMVQGLDAVEPAKHRSQVLFSLKSFIASFLPTIDKVGSLDTRQDCAIMMRSLCTVTPKGVNWRENRTWMLVEDVRWPAAKAPASNGSGLGEVVLTGVVRGQSLQADRLVHVGDWGDFQIGRISAAPLDSKKPVRSDSMMEREYEEKILATPTDDQDDLAELAPEEVLMEDALDVDESLTAVSDRKGVLLDDHHYFSDGGTPEPAVPKRVPRGTSTYQAAWFLGDESDSCSDMEDGQDEDEMVVDESFDVAKVARDVDNNALMDVTEGGPSEYPQSEMFLDPSPEDEAEELATYRSQRKGEAHADLEFPDEIELHPNVLARERLARYRGLKSFRTSGWDTEEDRPHEPTEWLRLLEVSDYRAAKARVLKESAYKGIQSGTRVHIHLRGVPLSLQHRHSPSKPTALFSLLRHEHKRTAVNYSITLNTNLEVPLKAKDEIIAQCGPRRFLINPVFSEVGNTPNDVHKFDRYLHPGRAAIASFIAPLTWGAVPVLYFKRLPAGSLQLIGTGTSQAPSRSRVIAKRVVLTGHPYKIHKRLVTVRYMFFNAEDVAWFKALQLWTRRGRSGFIKESLGTHGYFKSTFDGKLNPMDAVAISLYKRVWPRGARPWFGQEGEQQMISS